MGPDLDGRGTRLARRYSVVLAAVLVQLVLLAVAPSRPLATTGLADGPPLLGASPHTSPASDGDVAHGDLDPAATPAGPELPAGKRATGPTRGGMTPGTHGSTVPASAASVAHCVAGRQFDPAIDVYAPPCQPRASGANPGATWQGVTGDEILLVSYWVDVGAGPGAVLQAQDMDVSAEDQARFNAAAEKFINTHYELYGRKVRIVQWRNTTCSVQPPDESCFRSDAAQLVGDRKPFAVVNTYTFPMSFFYDELSQRRTVNLGGWQMTDSFALARRPYHWDPNISGTTMATTFADWYCTQLHGRPTQYAGTPRPPGESLNGRPRVLGVVTLDDPENKAVVNAALEPALQRCGARIDRKYFIEPNLARAAEQNHAAIAAMREPPEVTSLLVIGGPLMGVGHAQMQEENYYPEQLVPGNSMTDLDSVAQFFTGPSSCPQLSNCQAENMFGLAHLPPQEPRLQGVGARVWKAAGNSGPPPYAKVDLDWSYWSLLASLIQAAGPELTPATMERAAFALPPIGGTTSGWPLRHFRSGSYSWIQDMQVVYWSTTRRSRYNDAVGTWVPVGQRFQAGHSPTGPLLLPAKPR